MPIAAIHLHGYNVEDYRETIGQLDQEFKNADVESVVLVYHADHAREARQKNPDVARRLATRIQFYRDRGYTVIVTAHSNGNAILRLAFDLYDTSPDIAACIQPALPSTMHPSPGAKHISVYWNPDDRVVKLGRVLTWITKLISNKWAAERNWGQMGATGYEGTNLNVDNINTLDAFHDRRASGHSGIFDRKASGYWMNFIFKTSYSRALAICD